MLQYNVEHSFYSEEIKIIAVSYDTIIYSKKWSLQLFIRKREALFLKAIDSYGTGKSFTSNVSREVTVERFAKAFYSF